MKVFFKYVSLIRKSWIGFQVLGFSYFAKYFSNNLRSKGYEEYTLEKYLDFKPEIYYIIPTYNQANLVKNLIESWQKLKHSEVDFSEKIVIIDHNSNDENKLVFKNLEQEFSNISVLAYKNKEFNFSEINNWAVSQLKIKYKINKKDILIFLNNDTEFTKKYDLSSIISSLNDDSVGAVGIQLKYPNGNIQHSGVGFLNDFEPEHINRINLEHLFLPDKNYIVPAVTAAFLAIRFDIFEEIGGFNTDYPIGYNDIDLCLKIQKKLNRKIVYLGTLVMIHYESFTRKSDNENLSKFKRNLEHLNAFKKEWSDFIKRKFFYSYD